MLIVAAGWVAVLSVLPDLSLHQVSVSFPAHSHPTSSNNQQQLDQTMRKRKPQEQESMASKKQKNRETEEVVGEDVVEEVEEVEVEA